MELTAVQEVREEFSSYVEAVNKPPAMLKGAEVPKPGGAEGEMIVLRTTDEAAEWQEQVKYELAETIRDRASRLIDEEKPTVDTIHASIDLVRSNADIVPGTKQFNKELADQFGKFMKPYEKRRESDNKLIGWTIPAQGILDGIRANLAASKPAAPAAAPAPGTPTPQQQRAAEQARTQQGQFAAPPAPPETGIPSQAGQSADTSGEFDTLFGTLGLAPGTIRI